MALPGNDTVQRFQENEDRFDTFLNVNGTYTDKNGNPVETLPHLVSNVSSLVRVNIKSYGAIGDGVTDDTAALIAAFTNHKSVMIPDNFKVKISSKYKMPQGSDLYGENKYTSQIILSGDIDGIEMSPYCTVRTLRIIGNTQMTVDSGGRYKACLLLGNSSVDCYRGGVYDVILGGKHPDLGDSGVTRITGAGLKYGLAYLMKLDEVFCTQSKYGIEGFYVAPIAPATASITFNAMLLNNVECQGNEIGARMSQVFASSFNTCSFEGNDKEGLIVGGCRGLTLVEPYIEANNQLNTGVKKAEMWIEGSVAVVGIDAIGQGLKIIGGYFVKGPNSAFGIWGDKQGSIEINGPRMTSFTGATNPIYIGDNNTSGEASLFYSDSNVPFRFPSNFVIENWEITGTNNRGIKTIPKVNSKYGATVAVAAAASVSLFTPIAGSGWQLFVQTDGASSGVRWSGIIESHAGSAMTITPLASALLTISNVAGVVTLTNNHPSVGFIFNWSAIRVL